MQHHKIVDTDMHRRLLSRIPLSVCLHAHEYYHSFIINTRIHAVFPQRHDPVPCTCTDVAQSGQIGHESYSAHEQAW